MNPLTIDPVRECLMDGTKPFTVRGCLEWIPFGRFRVEGEPWLRTFLRDLKSLGANTMSFGTMLSWGPKMDPREGEPWWSALFRFADILGDEGVRGIPIAFADTALLMPNPSAQDAHWQRLLAHLGGFPHLNMVLVANQPGHHTQAMRPEDTLRFPKTFPHYLIARNNPFEDSNPVTPAADWSCMCTSRNVQKYQQFGSSGWYIRNGWPEDPLSWDGTHGPVVGFELPRIEAGTEYGANAKPSNGWDHPGIWREIARSLCFKGTLGANIYSRQGVNADLKTGVIRASYVEFLGNLPSP